MPPLVLAAAGGAVAVAHADRLLFLLLNHGSSSVPAAVWSTITIFGSGFVLFCVSGWLLFHRTRTFAALILLVPIAGLVSFGVKKLLQLPRPAAVIPLSDFRIIGATLTGTSMPSGHSLTAFAVAAILVQSARGDSQRVLGVIAVAGAVLVAWSRIAVGAHWPTDVLIGAALGWACGTAALALQRRFGGWHRAAARRSMAGVVCLAAITLLVSPQEGSETWLLQYFIAGAGLVVAVPIVIAPHASARRAWRRLAHRR